MFSISLEHLYGNRMCSLVYNGASLSLKSSMMDAILDSLGYTKYNACIYSRFLFSYSFYSITIPRPTNSLSPNKLDNRLTV